MSNNEIDFIISVLIMIALFVDWLLFFAILWRKAWEKEFTFDSVKYWLPTMGIYLLYKEWRIKQK